MPWADLHLALILRTWMLCGAFPECCPGELAYYEQHETGSGELAMCHKSIPIRMVPAVLSIGRVTMLADYGQRQVGHRIQALNASLASGKQDHV